MKQKTTLIVIFLKKDVKGITYFEIKELTLSYLNGMSRKL